MSDFDPIAVVESAYRPAVSRSEWIQAQGALVVPLLHSAPLFGGAGVAYFVGRGGPSDVAPIGPPPASPAQLTSFVEAGAEDMPPEAFEAVARATRSPGIASLASITGGIEGRSNPGPVRDSLALCVPLHDHGSVVFANFLAERAALDLATQNLWKRVAVHMSAGLRMVDQAGGTEADEVEAVLEGDGTLVHATGDAREHAVPLRDAVRAIDRARTRAGRSDPHAALQLWRGLLAGQWSLVEHFDHDGRRFMLARRNDPEIERPQPLTRRERQVVFYASLGWSNAEIGYALGLAVSTVATHLSRALRTLGLTTRAELIRLSASLAAAR